MIDALLTNLIDASSTTFNCITCSIYLNYLKIMQYVSCHLFVLVSQLKFYRLFLEPQIIIILVLSNIFKLSIG